MKNRSLLATYIQATVLTAGLSFCRSPHETFLRDCTAVSGCLSIRRALHISMKPSLQLFFFYRPLLSTFLRNCANSWIVFLFVRVLSFHVDHRSIISVHDYRVQERVQQNLVFKNKTKQNEMIWVHLTESEGTVDCV